MNTPDRPLGSESRSDTLRTLVRTLFERRLTAILFFALFAFVVMGIAYKFPPMYRVTGLILVKPGMEQSAVTFSPLSGKSSGPTAVSLEEINSEIAILTSRVVVERMVDQKLERELLNPPREKRGLSLRMSQFQDWCRSVGLVPTVDKRENMILNHQGRVQAEPRPLSNVIEVRYRDWSPKGAERTVNWLLDAYVDMHGQFHRDDGALAFFEEQVSEREVELAGVTTRLQAFRKDHDGGDLDQKRELLLANLIPTDAVLGKLEQIVALDESVVTGTALLENDDLARMRQRVFDLEQELQDLVESYSETDTPVVNVRAKLERARENLVREVNTLLKIYQASSVALRDQLGAIEEARVEQDELIAEATFLGGLLGDYRRKLEEERMAQAMEQGRLSSVRIIQRASAPPKPWFPNRFLLLLITILVGIPASLTMALLHGYLNGRVRTVHDVEDDLALPVLGTVAGPSLLRRVLRSGAERTRRFGDAGRLVTTALRREQEAELAKLNGNAPKESLGQIVHLAASTPYERVDEVARSVALGCLADERKTLLVQLSPGRKTTAPLDLKKALAAVDTSGEVPVLDLRRAAPAKLRALYEALRAEYEWIIVSGPPLGEGGGDGALSAYADYSVLVIASSGPHFEVARRSIDLLRRSSPNLVGAVLTERQDAVPGFLYRWI